MNIVNVKVTEAGLTVTYSDGNKLNHPDTNPKTNEKGAIFSYKTVGKDEHKTTLYAVKLGNVLGKALEVQGINVPNATLIDLPDGYALYERVKQYPVDDSGKAKPTRKDTYLFGNGSKFRSPAEFEDHILWLASDKASSCKCRYCDKDWCQNLSKKSNVFLLDETSNLPLTIQEINPKNKKKFISMYRCEEIVWGDIKYILNPSQYESLFEEVGADQIKYWPALVCKRLKEQYRNGFEILYMLKPLMLSRVKKLSYKFILPWLAYDSSNSTQAIGKELYSDSQIRLLRITKHYELVNAYLKAITRAKEIASTFTALQQYQYTLPSLSFTKIESVSERRLLQQMGTYPHFREILLGNEVLREDDYVRLTRASYNSTDKLPVFRINAIFLNALNKIQLSGDMFIRGPSKY
ncbi:7421_t:CDS:2, partial [Scutellospora calospora]